MSGFTDTYILEANRVQSQQYNDDSKETSIWTNAVSNGLKLNVGDKISINSGFISDLGAEDSTIEFKGDVIQKEQKFAITEVIDYKPVTEIEKTQFQLKPRANLVEQVINSSEVILKNIQDNDVNMLVSYYKTNNGEFMFNQPIWCHPDPDDGDANPAWKQKRENYNYVSIAEDGHPGSGMALKCSASHLYGEDYVADPNNKYSGLIMDNSRYMIFGQHTTDINWLDDATLNPSDNALRHRDMNGYFNYYIAIKDLLKFNVPLGFNSPSEISSVITDQLQKNTELKDKEISFYNANTLSVLKTFVGPKNETPTNKLFNCHTYNGLKRAKAINYYGISYNIGNGNVTTLPLHYGQEIRDYNSGFQYQGIKRPEVYITGCKLKATINNQGQDGRVDLNTIEYPQLPKLEGTAPQNDGDIINYYKTPAGSCQNQIPLKPSASNIPNERYPNYLIESGAIDDAYMKDNLNPYFTDFLSENPFRHWNDTPQNVKTTKTYNNSYPVAPNYFKVVLEITATQPLITWDNITDKATIECPSFPFSPAVVSIKSVEQISASEQLIEIGGLTNALSIGVGNNFTVITNILESYKQTPYTVINTGMEWNEKNLNSLKDFLEEQSRYPELFNMNSANNQLSYRKNVANYQDIYNGEDISVDTHRYLHLQSVYNSEMPKELVLEETENTASTVIAPITRDIVNNTGSQTFTSFGYDNIPSIFSGSGTSHGTVNTKDIDFSSMPLFIKYYKDYKNNGSGITSNEFKQTNWNNGKGLQYRPSFDAEKETGKNTWGGFALKTPSSCVIKPNGRILETSETYSVYGQQNEGSGFIILEISETTPLIVLNASSVTSVTSASITPSPSTILNVQQLTATTQSIEISGLVNVNEMSDGDPIQINFNVGNTPSPYNWDNVHNKIDVEIEKSYTPETELARIKGAGWNGSGGEGYATVPYQKSIYSTISFIAQVPENYLTVEPIATKIDANGVYQPNDAPVVRQIPTLYYQDYWTDLINKDIGDRTPASSSIQVKMKTDTRRIGYDNHPTAYGNAFIGLYNGLANKYGYSYNQEYYTGVNGNPVLDVRTSSGIGISNTALFVDEYLNTVYCGALAPELAFDTITNRFALSGLHTAEKITAKWNATYQVTGGDTSASKPSAITSVPIPDNLGKDIYKVNKIFDFRNYCPSISPYFEPAAETIQGTKEEYPIVYNNPYCKTGQIFDMTSGIFLEDFNIEKKNWRNSFWGICGFNYDDLNIKNSGNINARINNGNYNNIAKLTTNQNVENSNIGEWYGGATGVANYKNQYSYPTVLELLDSNGALSKALQTYAPVEIEGDSAKIEATDLPTKTLRPYFTIRSDIITDSYFTGGQNEPSVMPVIAVLQKNQQYGDFFYGSSDIEFTNTYPRTITQITTQICDPSGQPSKLSPNSAVMYKIVKQNNVNLNVVADVLKANKNNPNIQQSVISAEPK